MKKTMAYFATAILLGFAIMMLPLALETGPPTYMPQPEFLRPLKTNGAEMFTDGAPRLQPYGLGTQPLNLLPSSAILFLGLIVALGVYAILKKRMI